MAVPEPAATYHVLLIGIDSYAGVPLGGCVNDIDLVQRVLLGPRMAIPDTQIRRLASALSTGDHDRSVAAQPATLANIRAALAELGSDKVKASDRVFIYFSGHGTRVAVAGRDGLMFHREALVPVDYDAEVPRWRLLFDFELNAALDAITRRTRSVAVVLDCCFAAGVTRDDPELSGQRPRYLELQRAQGNDERSWNPLPDPAPASHDGPTPYGLATAPGSRGGSADRGLGCVDDCHVVAACLNHETAKEDISHGKKAGLCTRAFIDALEVENEAELRSVTWAQIWQAMQAHVERRNPWQHLWMAGSLARAVFGGPPVDGDPGIPVSRTDAGYRIEAGTLAGITPGAVLAVYGDRPPYFPRLDSDEDRRARLGLLHVIKARRADATAEAAGAAFELPHGARGRIVAPGPATRLRCALVPDNAEIRAQLAAAPLLEVVEPDEHPAVRLEYRARRWFVTDDKHGTGPDDPVLCVLRYGDVRVARAVLEHYHAYSAPLRLAQRAVDLPGNLVLRVLSCPSTSDLPAEKAQAGKLPEATSYGPGTYQLSSGARVCFQVRNQSAHRLYVTLVNCAASGRVQLLGKQTIEPDAYQVFWAGSRIGTPFQMTTPEDQPRCIDRLVAIGTTAMDRSLDHLRVDTRFADITSKTRGGFKDIDAGTGPDAPPIEHWTQAQAIIETRRGK